MTQSRRGLPLSVHKDVDEDDDDDDLLCIRKCKARVAHNSINSSDSNGQVRDYGNKPCISQNRQGGSSARAKRKGAVTPGEKNEWPKKQRKNLFNFPETVHTNTSSQLSLDADGLLDDWSRGPSTSVFATKGFPFSQYRGDGGEDNNFHGTIGISDGVNDSDDLSEFSDGGKQRLLYCSLI